MSHAGPGSRAAPGGALLRGRLVAPRAEAGSAGAQDEAPRRRARGRLAAALVTVSIAVAAAHPAMPWGGFAGLQATLDRGLAAGGLGIEQVSLEGHRYTPDSDVFDALDLANAASMVRFNGAEAAARILMLPWVQRVQILPLVPNGLHVVITERTPFAVWEPTSSNAPDGRRLLIDSAGHVLSPIGEDAFRQLPRFRGPGAATMAADLEAALALFPEIATRVREAELIGERRWALMLSRGLRVHLPAGEEAAALQRLAALQKAHGLLDKDVAVIDMRDPAISVRLAAPMTAQAAAASTRSGM